MPNISQLEGFKEFSEGNVQSFQESPIVTHMSLSGSGPTHYAVTPNSGCGCVGS